MTDDRAHGHLPGQVMLPALGYFDGAIGARTSGWSGSDTSHERAQRDDSDGTTKSRQDRVLHYLRAARFYGVTWPELVEAYPDMHHGSASGALSNLHKAGLIARLADERRQRCAVYVLPEYTGERVTARHGRHQRARVTLDHVADSVHGHEVEAWVEWDAPQIGCSCGWKPGSDGDYGRHLLEVIAKGAK